jgi:hypothetical protein
MTQYILPFIFAFSLISGYCQTTPSNWRNLYYEHFVTGDMIAWENTLKEMKNSHKKQPDLKLLTQIVKAQYGLTAYYIGQNEDDKAEYELKAAQKHLKHLQKMEPNNPIHEAMQGAFVSFEMSLKPYKIPFLGPESVEYIEGAYKKAPNNYRVSFEMANYKFYAPGFAGGDKAFALKEYKRTIQQIEQAGDTKDWYYLWALTAYTNALKKAKQSNLVHAQLIKMKQIEPRYKWAQEQIKQNKELWNGFEN